MNVFFKKGLLGLSALMLAGTVMADEQANPAPMEHKAGPGMHAMHPMTPEQMKAQMAKHAAQLHDKLKLTAAQEPAWNAFVASMTPPEGQWKPGDMKAKRAEMAKLPAPEMMEKQVEMLKQHQERASARLAALKTFYAVLTPEQQKTFDANAHQFHDRMHAALGRHEMK